MIFAIFVAALVAALVPATAAASDRDLARAIGAQMRVAGGGSGAWVADESTEKPLFASAADVRRTPASVQKLLTTSTALDRFGNEEHLKTIVRVRRGSSTRMGYSTGNLYLQGFGDPSFETRDIALLASRVRAAGVRSVEGRVYGDETYFDSRRGLPAGRFQLSTDVGPLSALSFNEGTMRGFGFGFQSNPPSFVAQRLDAWLDLRGVEVARAPRAGNTPQAADLVTSVRSPSIAALVRRTNQLSDNYYAETLLKGLGARFAGAGSTTAGATVVRRFQQEIGVSSAVLDGSGLSRGNAVSPRSVGRLLLRRPGSARGSSPSTGRCHSPGGQRHASQTDARNCGGWTLPGEDRHAAQRQRTGGLLPLQRRRASSSLRC